MNFDKEIWGHAEWLSHEDQQRKQKFRNFLVIQPNFLSLQANYQYEYLQWVEHQIRLASDSLILSRLYFWNHLHLNLIPFLYHYLFLQDLEQQGLPDQHQKHLAL